MAHKYLTHQNYTCNQVLLKKLIKNYNKTLTNKNIPQTKQNTLENNALLLPKSTVYSKQCKKWYFLFFFFSSSKSITRRTHLSTNQPFWKQKTPIFLPGRRQKWRMYISQALVQEYFHTSTLPFTRPGILIQQCNSTLFLYYHPAQ